jgi:hypothetical protein
MAQRQGFQARRLLAIGLLAGAVGAAVPARADNDLSAASALSLVPVAVVSAAPALLLSAGASFTVVAVEASADGAEWVIARTSDGMRGSLRVAGGASLAVGTAITVTAVSAGWLLSTAGRVVAFVPNAVGRRLTHHERVSR